MALNTNYLLNKSSKTEEEKEQTRKKTEEIIKKVNSGAYDFGVDDNYINSFLEEADKYISDTQSNVQNIGYKTAGSTYENNSSSASGVRQKAQTIKAYLNTHSNVPKDTKDRLLSYIESFERYSGNVVTNLYQTKNYYNKWETEEDYNDYVAQTEENQRLLKYDIEGAKAEKAELEAKNKENKEGTATIVAKGSQARITKTPTEIYDKDVEDKKATQAAINKLTQDIALATRMQNAEKLKNDAVNASDFKLYSDMGANIKNPTVKDANGFITTPWGSLGGDKINNIVTYSRDNWQEIAMSEAEGGVTYGKSLYRFMTESEVSIYNYYLAKEGEEKANEYLDSIEESLNYRQANSLVEGGADIPAFEFILAASAGLEQAGSGIRGIGKMLTGDESYTPTSSTQFASGMVREDLEDVGVKLPDWAGGASIAQVAYDAVNTGANMLPSILVGSVAGAGVGAAMLGTGASGNAYTEMINLGYDKGQASSYAALVGASEAALSYVLGGISKLGGKLSGKAVEGFLKNVDNALARTAIQLGGNMVSEFTEEYLQEVLDPFFRNLTLGEDNDVKLYTPEALYSGILGALTAGVMEGPSTIASNVSTYKTGKQLQGSDLAIERLKKLGSTMSADSVAYRLAGKVDENTGAYTIGRLFNEIGAEITEANKADIQKSLERKGIDPKSAKTITEILASVVEGAELTSKQQAMLNKNEDIAKTLVDVIINPNSTVNQRSGQYSEVYNLAKEVTGVKETEATGKESLQVEQNAPKVSQKTTGKEVASSKTSSQTETETVVQGESQAVAEGKARYTIGSPVAEIEKVAASFENATKETPKQISAMFKKSGVSVETFVKGVGEAYRLGTYGYPINSMNEVNTVANSLPSGVRMQAYYMGRNNAEAANIAKGKAQQAQVKRADISGEIIYEGDAQSKVNNEHQMSTIELIDKVLKDPTGIKYHLYASYLNSEGERVYVNSEGKVVPAPNGIYNRADRSIWIDVNAGVGGRGIMLYTLAHELVHDMKVWSPEHFNTLLRIASEVFEKSGESFEAAVADKLRLYYGNKDPKTGRMVAKDHYTEKQKAIAQEEVVAETMSAIFKGEKTLAEFSAQVKKADLTLWEKIKAWFKDVIARINKAYKDVAPESDEAKLLLEQKKLFEKAQKVFAEGIVKAGENFHNIGAIDLESFNEAKTQDGDSLFQYRAMETDEETYRSMLKKWGKISDAQIENLFSTIDMAVDTIKANLEALDYAWEADIDDRAFSPVKPNSDSLYQVSVDFSTLCRKRLLQQAVQAQLQQALNRQLSRDEGIAIRDALMKIQEEGRQIEVACALCYVESARMKSPAQIMRFLENRESVLKDFFAGKSKAEIKQALATAEAEKRAELGVGETPLKKLPQSVASQIRAVKKEVKKAYVPTAEEQELINTTKDLTVSDFTTPQGLEYLAKKYPRIFDAYTSFIRNATKSKGIENDTWWRAGDSQSIGDTLIENMNKENGLRSQSWSDFQVVHMLDYIAAVIELSTRNSKMQVYTKVPDYVELMGLTNAMINLSLIPTREFNGTLEFDSVEGMDFDKSMELRDKYHNTVGNIVIGVNNVQVKLAFDDVRIDYVIPYHQSGMSKDVRTKMHIPNWTPYESYQTETKLKGAEAEENARKYGVKLLDGSDPNYHKAPSFSEWFDYKEAKQIAEMENANPSDSAKQKKYGIMYGGYMAMQNAANNYLKLCAERGLAPEFSHPNANFAAEENYWKVLIDRKMIDNITGEIIEQKPLKPIFDRNEVRRILDDEIKRYPKVKADQEYAIRKVTESFLAKENMSPRSIAEAMQKPVDNITKTSILEASKEMDEERYSLRDEDYVTSGSKAVMTTDRINYLIEDSGAGSRVDYAQAWITSISPTDYLNLTTDSKTQDRETFDKLGSEWDSKVNMTNYDYRGQLGKSLRQTPYLAVDINTGKVVGHDGRHRIRALEKEGVESVEIKIEFRDEGYIAKYAPDMERWETKDSIKLINQFGTKQTATIHNVIPLNEDHRSEIEASYGEGTAEDSDIRYALRDSEGESFVEDKYYARQINKWDELIGGSYITVGKIKKDSPLNMVGIPDDKLYFDVSKIKETMKNHGEHLSVTDLEKIPQLLNHPIAITEYKPGRGEKTASVYGNLFTEDGTPIVVGVVITKGANKNVISKVRTIHARKDFENQITDDSVLYLSENKKETIAWFRLLGIDVPLEGKKFGFIRILPQDDKIVKSEDNERTQERLDTADRNRLTILENQNQRLEKELADLEKAYEKAQDYAHAEGVLVGQMEQGAKMAKEMRQKQEAFNRKAEGYEKAIAAKKKQIADIRAKRDELLEKAKAEKQEAVEKIRRDASERLEKKLAEAKAHERAKLTEAKDRSAEKQQAIRDKYRDSIKKATENRHRTVMRHKIKGVVSELNQMLNHQTKERHIPESMKAAVASALEILNLEDRTYYESRLRNLEDRIKKATSAEESARLKIEYNKLLIRQDDMKQKLADLKEGYEEIKETNEAAYDPVVAGKIEAVAEIIKDTNFRDMSMAQLEEVYSLYKMIRKVVGDVNKLFVAQRAETISQAGQNVIGEVEHVGGNHPLRIKGAEKIGSFMWNNLKPVYAFMKLGSKTLEKLFNNVRAGEDTWAKDVSEARDFFKEKSKKYHYDKWDMKKKYTFKSNAGQKFTLTLPQIMSLYAYSKRKQADVHLAKGGFVFDTNIEVVEKKHGIPVKYNVNTATAHNISRETLFEIAGKLTGEQKAFVDEMQNYLSSVMGEKGNEVSMAMYDIRLFNEKNYFPLKSAKQFMFEQNQTAGEVKLKNSGFSKETRPNASNPIILSDFMDVWAGHVNDMSMYHAFVLPLEDFNRVFNYKTPASEDFESKSVNQAIQNAYGKEANKYISELIKDLNGGARSDNTTGLINKLIGGFKKASVFASASVVIQQPSAVVRASAIIGDKYFLGLPKLTNHKATWEEVKKYAPVAVIKEMGYFDTNMGRSTVDYIKDEKTLGSRTDDFFSWAPSYADETTWCAIWNAVKRETKAKNPGLNSKSEEFLKKAGERFTEVVVKTQVYDSVLSRSANMRSTDTGMKMATAFMAEPTTSINMLEDAVRQWKRGNKKQATNQIAAVYGSIILNAALVSLVYAARDDDEDENYLEKYLSSLTSEIIDGFNPLTMIPFIKDAWSIAQGFDVERADMSLVTKLWEAFEKASTTIFEDTFDMDEEELAEHNKEVNEAIAGIADYVAALFGLPVKNIRRDINAALNLYGTLVNGPKSSMGSVADKVYDAMKNAVPLWGRLDKESKGDKLYDAIKAGDEVYADRLRESTSATALRGALRDNDSRIREAALARINGDPATYMRIAKEIIADGFSQDDVVKAINAEINAINKGEDESSSDSKATGFFKTDDYISALIGGDQAAAEAVKNDIIATAVVNGKTQEEAEKSFATSFKSTVWDGYEDGELTKGQVSIMLTNYGDMDEEEVNLKFQVYEWKATVPGADDITASAIADYNEFAEPAGISKADYYKGWRIYCDTDADIDPKTGEGIAYSKVKKVMPQIDALPLTAAQKTALAKCWWAESTVRKYKTW